MSNNIEKEGYLEELDGVHDPNAVPDMVFGKLPDNSYHARLDKIYIAKSKASDRWQTVMEFEVLSGSYAFRKVFKFCQMSTEENLNFLTNDLWRLNVPKSFKWANIEKEFAKVVDHIYEITLQTKGEFQNVYIQKELNPDQVLQGEAVKDKVLGAITPGDTTPLTPLEDDIPF